MTRKSERKAPRKGGPDTTPGAASGAALPFPCDPAGMAAAFPCCGAMMEKMMAAGAPPAGAATGGPDDRPPRRGKARKG